MSQSSLGYNMAAMYRKVRVCDPLINRALVGEKYLKRAQQDLEVILTILDKELPENQYILIHARDVRTRVQQERDRLKGATGSEDQGLAAGGETEVPRESNGQSVVPEDAAVVAREPAAGPVPADKAGSNSVRRRTRSRRGDRR